MKRMYSLGRRRKLHRMVHGSRMNRTSSSKMPFDRRGILLSFLFLQKLAVAQIHHLNLMWHQKSHSNYRDFQCSLCSKTYKYEARRRGHMRAKHSSESTPPLKTSMEQVQESKDAGNRCSECKNCFKS
ncbi:hypothetical protein X801_10542, partial [Opisthorchis viverrini]